MKTLFKNLFLPVVASVLLFAVSPAALAQKSFEVKAKFIAGDTGSPIEFATVSLTPKGSEKVLVYTTTDSEGNALLKGVKPAAYVISAELMGYKKFEKEIEVSGATDLGQIKMDVENTFLDAAKVSAVGNAIIMKKDTIEFNASSFKTTDNDMLEDLLKKLPGVEVDSDGTITANGKEINKIYIDGKEFFLDDPQLATKNIPAKIVEKVKVREKKSEQAEFTGIDDGNETTVIDLTVMKGMMNGWFGNLMGGGGTDLQTGGDKFSDNNDIRFQGAGMVANINEKSQLAFIGNANNTNNRGFNDLTGNMMASMRGPGGGMGRGGAGMNFRGNGINTSYLAGVNANTSFGEEGESTLAGNYLFTGNDKYVEETSSKTTLQNDGTSIISDETGYSNTETYGHRAGARIDWKIAEGSSILFVPDFNFGYGRFDEHSDFSTDAGDADGNKTSRMNYGDKTNYGENQTKTAHGFFLYRQRLGKPGRTLSVHADYELSANTLDKYDQSHTYTPASASASEFVDQNVLQSTDSKEFGTRISYTEPIGGNFFAEASYAYNYSHTDSEKETFDKSAAGEYDVKNERYSNIIANEFVNQRMGLSLMKQEEGYNVTVGLNYQPAKTTNVTTIDGVNKPIEQNVKNWAPHARIDFNFSDDMMLRVRYRGNTSQPTITQLQPIEDNSNPLSITLGNPELKPYFSHDMFLMFFNNNRETFSSLNANLDMKYNTSSIVNAIWTGSNGVTYSVPLDNEKPTFSANARVMYNSPIAKSNFSIMSHTFGNFADAMSYIGDPSIDGTDSESYLNRDNFTENRYRTFSLSEYLRLTYRDDYVEVTAGGRTRVSKSWYEIPTQEIGATWTNSLTSSINWTAAEVWNLVTDVRYTFYKGYAEAYNDPVFVWNAEIQKQILQRKATLALKCYDILNQSRNTYRTITDNYIQDVRNNTLGRYIMLSFTYRFGNFGGEKMDGKNGPGMGPGGMGPGGPGMPPRR